MTEPVKIERRKPPVGRRGSARGNRERILEASLKLFGENGVAAVSTNTIAGHLGISPGNLYYHFANKEHILRELWVHLEDTIALPYFESLDALATSETGVSPENLASLLSEAFRALRRFWFIYRDLEELTARDPKLAEKVRFQIHSGRSRLIALFGSLIDHKVMSRPTNPQDLDRICTNLLLVIVHWVQFVTIATGVDHISPTAIAEGGLHAFVLLEPRLEANYARQTRVCLEQQLDQEAAEQQRIERHHGLP